MCFTPHHKTFLINTFPLTGSEICQIEAQDLPLDRGCRRSISTPECTSALHNRDARDDGYFSRFSATPCPALMNKNWTWESILRSNVVGGLVNMAES